MVYRNNAGRLGAGFISVCLETRWLGQKRGPYVPDCYCSVRCFVLSRVDLHPFSLLSSPLEKENDVILGSKREDQFYNPFFDLVQNSARYIFRTWFGTNLKERKKEMYVRACRHCECSCRRAKRLPGDNITVRSREDKTLNALQNSNQNPLWC